MGTYFHGWRRILGVMTLVMTLLLTFGWIRSNTIQDEILVRFGDRFEYAFRSSPYGLQWSSRRSNTPEPPTDGTEWIQYQTWIFLDKYPDLFWFDREWQLDYCGFHFGQGTNPVLPRYREHYWMIPYWSIVIPLTLLSAYLGLSKPQTPHQKKITDPIHVDGLNSWAIISTAGDENSA